MRALTVIPERGGQRNRSATKPPGVNKTKTSGSVGREAPPTSSLERHPRPHTHQKASGRTSEHVRRAFTPLIDAKIASTLLGVPYTWLLAQARAGKIPHHRLGHYVRFDPDDLQAWLRETRNEPYAGHR